LALKIVPLNLTFDSAKEIVAYVKMITYCDLILVFVMATWLEGLNAVAMSNISLATLKDHTEYGTSTEIKYRQLIPFY